MISFKKYGCVILVLRGNTKSIKPNDLIFHKRTERIGMVASVEDERFCLTDELKVEKRDVKKVVAVFSFETEKYALDRIKRSLYDIFYDHCNRTFLIEKSELLALVSVLPDANLVGKGVFDEKMLQGVNNVTFHRQTDGSELSVSIVGIIKDTKTEEVRGITIDVSGNKFVVALKKSEFVYYGNVRVITYHWTFNTDILSDESGKMIRSCGKAFNKMLK